MAKSEQAILHETLIAASALPRTLIYRQNTGTAWRGEKVQRAPGAFIKVEPGMVVLRNGQLIKFGIEGGGDFCGVSDGVPIQAEAKTLTGTQREAQGRFGRAWELAGGRYILFRSPEDFLAQLRRG
jgi:hypothetical protein